jgi:hypothetical protein
MLNTILKSACKEELKNGLILMLSSFSKLQQKKTMTATTKNIAFDVDMSSDSLYQCHYNYF